MKMTRALLALLVVTSLCAACGKKEEAKTGPAKRPSVPVVAETAKVVDFPVESSQMGTVEPVQSTPVRAQVGGQVVAVLLREGQNVAAGQELFRIDQRTIEGNIRQLEADRARYEAAAKSAEAQAVALETQVKTTGSQTATAEANARTAESQAELARAQFERYTSLAEKEFVTKEQLDQMRTAAEASKSSLAAARAQVEATKSATESARANAEAAKSAVASARASKAAVEASIENAKIQLGYTIIRSPIPGQAGSLLVKMGDYVKGNGDTPMVVINQLNPILVRFSLPEPLLPDLQAHRKSGDVKVTVDLPGGGTAEGNLVFIDNTVDRATGTITVKASFDNKEGVLWPGQYVPVTLKLYVKPKVIVVPSAGVQTGQKGPYAYVIGSDSTVSLRLVQPGLSRNGMTIVESGIAAGEKVVTDGHLKLTPGSPVTEKSAVGSEPAKPGKPEGTGK